MECTWDAALLRRADELPPELLDVIQHGNDSQYLQGLTRASLDPRYTCLIFSHCENVFPHICATLASHGTLPSAIATLGRVVPFAPHLTRQAERLLAVDYTFSSSGTVDDDLQYLLGLFRLFSSDERSFKKFIQPSKITTLLAASSRPVVYLAIRILQIYYHGADHWFEQMIMRYLGEDRPDGHINGQWDNIIIDYRFLSLWERDKFQKVLRSVEDATCRNQQLTETQPRVLRSECFDDSTALVGGILLSRQAHNGKVTRKESTELILTPTVTLNLNRVALALKTKGPLLIEGPQGSGKSLLVRHIAQRLGKLEDMVTLHLNQQSDAKLLIGIYTTGQTPGSFVWKPGVLTTAVEEGRWVVIEDIDRAPDGIIGTILPLIEKGELSIPNRKQKIHAAPGFKIIATVRTSLNHRGQSTSSASEMLGIRHWQRVPIEMPPSVELHTVVKLLYPDLSGLLPQFIAVYQRLIASWSTKSRNRQSSIGAPRSVSPRDLLKWCGRVSNLMKNKPSLTSNDMDNIFLEGVDCFIGALPDGQTRHDFAALVAEELRIDPRRRDYLLGQRDVRYAVDGGRIDLGRYSVTRSQQSKKTSAKQVSFSTNPHTIRMLEKVAGGVVNREPLLLVGETGVGKTTAVQYLATHLGKKLVPFNLSQQSEAGDLLGGFKPVNARSLFVPMKDEFDELFAASFSLSKNQQFLDLMGKQVSRSNWRAVCKLWQQALSMVDQQRTATSSRSGEAPSKKRKVEPTKSIDFARWNAFAGKVTDMERRLATGNDAFGFSFVEGNIVKALRNGDWVLLDEVNLASTDTLESIADLLDPSSPSLLLTESGNIERVEAHPSFRIFAAMNPATDVGKRDLPPGIRSRFTELYVESPDRDIKSLSSIVQSYLRHEMTGDQTVPADVSKLYQNIVTLAAQNQLVDGAGSKPHFSLRTLTRTLSYAKYIAPFCSLRRALYEGFQMSFLTLLDAESVRTVQPLIEQGLFGKRTNVRAELQKALRRPSERHVLGYPGSKHWVQSGSEKIAEESHYILTPFIRNNLENLVRATSTRQFPVLIQGPTSSGKTSMIEYLAKRTGHRFVRINNHEHTDLQEYLGTYVSGLDGRLQFQDGILVKALREGHWIVLDELNLAPTDVLEALNRLLDDNRELMVPETQEVIRPHEDFMLFATQNPAGLYGGRKVLSRAFRNRFLELHFDDIPIDELQEILHRRTQLPESRAKRIVDVYRDLSVLRQENRLFEQKSFATLRDLFRWAQRPNDTIEQLAANGFMLLGERARKDEDRRILKGIIEKAMSANGPRVVIDESHLYSAECKELLHYEDNARTRGVVWTKAMRRLYVLVARALQNDEPVLLVGETGCGKTTVCQMLADALDTKLHSVNAHQNTETGDLIGSQRPVRNRAAIETSLRNQLLASELLRDSNSAAGSSTEVVLEQYDQILASFSHEQRTSYIQSSHHLSIVAERTRCNALFEWVDGSLVQAMKEGAFFLLDEISLADDSVLERINSVLESQRSILLAEKGSLDSSVTASAGFQFFATMNPGGDYGKRELSPALRNRFTEIWVPSLSDAEDVVQIVQEKLAPSAKKFAQSMVSFAKWFRERYNTSAMSAISIRDALSWVSFVNSYAESDLSGAIVHGAAMVYIDTLGANPAGLMATNRKIELERSTCIDQLSQILGLDAHSTYFSTPEVKTTNNEFLVGPFSHARHAGSRVSNFSFDPTTTKTNAMRVLRALQLRKPIMLEGNPGVGKTALITAIAEAVGVPLTRINLSEQTDLIDLFGSDVPVEGADTGNFSWRGAPFLRAMKSGQWVLLDEMNLASQSVLEGLNACLDHRGEVFVPELGQTFNRHPNFRLFAAQNPHHQGAGRKGLPASFVNRFTVVYADTFRPDDLKLISERSFTNVDSAIVDKIITFVDRLDHEVSQHRRIGAKGAPWEFNYRDISRLLSLATTEQGLLGAGNVRDFIDMLILQRFRSAEDKAAVDFLFTQCFGDELHTSDLFPSVSSQHGQIGVALLPRNKLSASHEGLQPTPGPRYNPKLLQAVMVCVQQSWPVILTGRSGAGKTELIEHLAAFVGANVVTLAINAETDSMDLIGGFEQTDLNWHMARSKRHLHQIANSELLSKLLDGSFENPLEQKPSNGDSSSRVEVSGKPRFEWIDGILVDAMQEGKWMILDNANLCSPSVLDRLNSLLEPNGVLIMNERSTADGSPRIVIPHPGFRIFLTVNPRYGELSRAMRNRAVELNLPEEVQAGVTTAFATESSMARFQDGAVSTISNDEVDSVTLASTVIDHHSPADEVLLWRFKDQVSTGLYSFARPLLQGLEKALQSRSRLQAEAQTCSTRQNQAVISQLQVPADFARVQTFHPLNNQALIQISGHGIVPPLTIACVYDYSTHLGFMSERIHSMRTNSSLVAKINRLERSLGLASRTSQKNARASSTLDLAQSIVDNLSLWLSGILTNPSVDTVKLKSLLGQLTGHATTLLERIARGGLDAASLNAFLIIGKCIVTTHSQKSPEPTDSPLNAILDQLISNLMKTGHNSFLSCSALWKDLRPVTPTDQQRYDGLLRLEAVVSRFDEICRQFVLPLEKMIDLRRSFMRTLKLAHHLDQDTSGLSSVLEEMLPKSSSSESEATPKPAPYFLPIFRQLNEHFAALTLGGHVISPEESTALDLFALRGINESRPYHRADDELATSNQLYSLEQSVACCVHEDPRDMSNAAIGSSLIGRLRGANEVALSRLDLLDAEVGCLGRAISSHIQVLNDSTSRAMDVCLKRLLDSILQALTIQTDDQNLKQSAILMLERLQAHSQVPLPTTMSSTTRECSLYLAASLDPVVNYLLSPYDDESTKLRHASNAWATFACVCLELYVPQGPFDPALDAQFRTSMYRWQSEDLNIRLKAIQRFREVLTGNANSLRAQIIQQDIATLGPAPQTHVVFRPEVSQLPELQQDLASLLRILRPMMEVERSTSPILPLNPSLMSNIIQARNRLSLQYRAYEDFTAPITGFIDCLLAGHRFAVQAQAKEYGPAAGTGLGRIIPFADASSISWVTDDAFIESNQSLRNGEEMLCWLAAIAGRSVNRSRTTCGPALWQAIDHRFHHFYQRWKVELEKERRVVSQKSSLYKFRHQETEMDDTNLDDLEELFPTQLTDGSPDMPGFSAQDEACRVAQMHTNVLLPKEAKEDNFTNLLRRWAADTENRGALDEDHLSPALILLVHDLRSELQPKGAQGKAYNIYADSNIAEMKRLAQLVGSLIERFRSIQQAWPEHATPGEVLRQAEEILAIPYSTALSVLLPRLEKLYAAANDWQSIASREFSIQSLLADLSDLIISWRQLELSTWSGLFDREWEQCQKMAASWWYIAYDTIIAATRDMEQSPEELMQHSKELLTVLSDFVDSSGLGEFSARLQMLRGFEAHVSMKVKEHPRLHVVEAGLSNFNRFYRHFEPAVAGQISGGRKVLEKDIKNAIQVASWKDRNIDTLRQSAQSSHKKLLRLVRKFRNLLAQPVSPIIQDGIQEEAFNTRSDVPDNAAPRTKMNDMPSHDPVPTLTIWQERAARFQNPNHTSSLVETKLQSVLALLDGPEKLEAFKADLKEQISELQRSTPMFSTEENQTLIRHLKTRKRRLLADVLKLVRKMGYAPAVSEQVLQEQSALSTILARLRPLSDTKSLAASSSEHELHRLLCVMPKAREAARKHSDDLTAAEALRCTGLLESILQHGIANYNALADHHLQFLQLEKTFKKLKSLGMADSYKVRRAQNFDVADTRAGISYLSKSISTAIDLLRCQAALSSRDYSELLKVLEGTGTEVETLLVDAHNLSDLPQGVQNDDSMAVQNRISATTGNLQADVESLTSANPETRPILLHLLKWTVQPSAQSNVPINGHPSCDLNTWAGNLLGLVDSILASVQDAHNLQAQFHKDAWVTTQARTLNETLNCLRMQQISQRTSSLMAQLHDLADSESSSLGDCVSMSQALWPIFEAYQRSISDFLELHSRLHARCSNVGYSLATSFIEIANRGFCTPGEKSQEKSGESGDVETGTGLGDGEGAEDISKDIGDEEDLSELANDSKDRTEQGDLDQEQDAVDMADEEMEGEAEDVKEGPDKERNDNGSDEEEGAELDEEAGETNSDSNAIDEKLWDGEAENKEKEKQAESRKGASKNDESTAAEQTNDVDEDDTANDEAEAVAAEEGQGHEEEKLDPHVDEGSNLDLPDDMEAEGNQSADDEDVEMESMPDDPMDVQDTDSPEPDDTAPAANEEESELASNTADNDFTDPSEGEEEQDAERPNDENIRPPDLQLPDDQKPNDDPNDGATLGNDGNESNPNAEEAEPNQPQQHQNPDQTEDPEEPRKGSGTEANKGVGEDSKEKDSSVQGQNESAETDDRVPFKQLGDVLDEWYDKHREISDARQQDQASEERPSIQANMRDVEFEHLPDEHTEADTQAVGGASTEQSVVLNEDNAIHEDDDAMETGPKEDNRERQNDFQPEDQLEDPMQVDSEGEVPEAVHPSSFVGEQKRFDETPGSPGSVSMELASDEMDDMDQQMTSAHISKEEEISEISFEDAMKLWAKHEESTYNSSLILTEHLRLILQPTQATKMRGDFRTGKRLNIKRIIPYIASSYKRDKIWMRRSAPTKRSYQIMLAIDDSKSMAESRSNELAFETLSLIAKSLSMLEVGELSVIGFGERVKVAHEFSTPFNSDAGARTFQQFTFSQGKTDVRRLLTESIAQFRSARLRASGAGSELWQLQLIISDGICDDHPTIRQLVREAHEERIMIVFIVVDFATSSGDPSSTKQSILDMQTAQFIKDESGTTQLKMLKYLDTFPFAYFLIVQNIRELPEVLAGALRQWFAEVVETES